MNRTTIPVTSILLFCATLLVADLGFAQTTTYTVKRGDTCERIAKSVYGDANRVDLLHVHNDLEDQCWRKEKGGKRLTVGTVLTLPEPPPDARVTSRTGEVKAKSPKADWESATPGKELFRAWRVNTLEKAKAEVTFEDSSKVRMRENTLIVIYGATKSAIRKTPTKATLRKGALRSKLDALAGNKTIEVETPTSISELSTGSALVTVEESGKTRIANHSGKPVTVRGKKKKKKRRKKVTIKAGMGSTIEKNKDPTPPKKLPETPTWASKQTKFVTLQNAPKTISVSWASAKNADSYYVEFSEDPASLQIVQSAVVKSGVTNLEVQQLPVGDYYVRVAAIDSEQFESPPTKARKVSVVSIVTPSEIADSQIAIGGRFVAPRGIVCDVSGNKEKKWTLRDLGPVDYRCFDESGIDSGTVSIVSTPPAATFQEQSILGTRHYVDLKFPQGVAYDQVSFNSNEYELGEAFAIAPDTLRVPVDGRVEFGTVSAEVAGETIATTDVTKELKVVDPFWFSAGVSGTGVFQPVAVRPIDVVSGLGGSIAIFPTSMFGAEFSGRYVTGHSSDAAFSPGVDARGGGLVVLGESELRGLLSLGVGSMLFFGDEAYDFSAVPLAYAGVGAAYFFNEGFGLRADLTGALSTTEQSPTVLPGLAVQVLWK